MTCPSSMHETGHSKLVRWDKSEEWGGEGGGRGFVGWGTHVQSLANLCPLKHVNSTKDFSMNPGKKKVNRQLNKNPIYFEKELCNLKRWIYIKYILRTLYPRLNRF